MPKANYIQTNMTGGEVSPYLYSRVDTEKYQNGCKTLENFIVTTSGSAKKRTGSKFVWYARNSGSSSRLVPFNYNAEQAYVIEASNLRLRFFTNGGILTETAQAITGITNANPAVVTYSGSDTYANGDRVAIGTVLGMTEVNNREFTVANVNAAANTFELSGIDSTSYGTYTSGGTVSEIIEVTTTYTTAELDALSFAQSADTLFIAHPDHKLAKLVRNSATSWTLSDVDVLRGPWRSLNNDETITLQADAKSGNVTLTASAATFNADHVGAKFKVYLSSRGNGDTEWGSSDNAVVGSYWSYNGNVYEVTADAGTTATSNFNPPVHLTGTVRSYKAGSTTAYSDCKFIHKGYGIATITAYTSTTVADGDVYSGYGYEELPQQIVTGSSRFQTATTFWQEGAWSTYRGYPEQVTFFEQRLMASKVQTVYGSVSGNFSDFEEGANDDQALNYTLASEQVDAIRWLNPGKQLLIGTTSGEYVMGASSLGEAVTPKNIKISRETSYGSAPCKPVRVGEAVLFMQRHGDPANDGRKMREMAYNFDIDGYASNDLTIFAPHITGTGVTELAYQADPDALIWGVRADGALCCLTYQREHQVTAWHRHLLGGTNVEVESVCAIPGTNGDELWLKVKRTIDGGTVRYIEVLSYFDDNTAKANGIFVDSAITTSTASNAATGLWFLRGQTVKYLLNGTIGSGTVSSTGTLTITGPDTTPVQIGLGYTAKLETLDLEAGAAAGSAQGRQKRISNATLRLNRSQGGRVGSSTVNDAIDYSDQTDATALYTGDRTIVMPTGWDDKASVYIEHSDPTPFEVLAIISEINTTG